MTKVFLESNFKVFAGRFMSDWPELDEFKNEYGEDLDILSLDVTNEQSVDADADYIKEKAGQLDILINNAGNLKERSVGIFGEFYYEDMMKLIDTNTFGPLSSFSLSCLFSKSFRNPTFYVQSDNSIRGEIKLEENK